MKYLFVNVKTENRNSR